MPQQEPIAARLARSILPLIVPDDRDPSYPARCGSCVLVRLLGREFLVTARHVFGDLSRRDFHLGRQGHKLIHLSVPDIYSIAPPENLDVAVVPLDHAQTAKLEGLTFIPETSVVVERKQYLPGDAFLVFGFPDSNSQFRPDRARRNIRQQSFLFHTGPAADEVASRESIETDTHLILQFDPDQVTVAGKPRRPPNPRGISGGAAFHLHDGKPKLAGIMIEHRKASRVMVSVRMSEVLEIAQHVIEAS